MYCCRSVVLGTSRIRIDCFPLKILLSILKGISRVFTSLWQFSDLETDHWGFSKFYNHSSPKTWTGGSLILKMIKKPRTGGFFILKNFQRMRKTEGSLISKFKKKKPELKVMLIKSDNCPTLVLTLFLLWSYYVGETQWRQFCWKLVMIHDLDMCRDWSLGW